MDAYRLLRRHDLCRDAIYRVSLDLSRLLIHRVPDHASKHIRCIIFIKTHFQFNGCVLLVLETR